VIFTDPNAHASTEDRSYVTKDSFYEELEYVFHQFPKHHVKVLLGDFNAKVETKDIFMPFREESTRN
jgi:exonuclease III